MADQPGRKITYKTKVRIGPSGVKVTHPDELTGEYPPEPEPGPTAMDAGRRIIHKTYRVQRKVRLNLPGPLIGLLIVVGLIVLAVQLILRR